MHRYEVKRREAEKFRDRYSISGQDNVIGKLDVIINYYAEIWYPKIPFILVTAIMLAWLQAQFHILHVDYAIFALSRKLMFYFFVCVNLFSYL